MLGQDRSRYWMIQLGLLWMRIALGLIFMAHGSQKLFGLWGGYGISATAAFFYDQLGIPLFFAYIAIFTEFFGGLGILTGLFTRVASFGISIIMGVAIFKVHLANGFFLNYTHKPGVGDGIEYTIALLGLSIALVLTGAGRFSLDYLFFSRKTKVESHCPACL